MNRFIGRSLAAALSVPAGMWIQLEQASDQGR
jgi:hypothetical protein